MKGSIIIRSILLFVASVFMLACGYSQWEHVVTFENTQFGSNPGWVSSDNGSPWDCSNSSLQKNPVVNDHVYVTHELETGYLYRYTFYLKARVPQVFCKFSEGPDNTLEGNELGFAYNQSGSGNYTYTSGSMELMDAAAMICGDEFKYTSDQISGDGQVHFLKVIITGVNGDASNKPFRVAHCIIERRTDNSYLFPLAPSGLTIDTVINNTVELIWVDNSSNEDGFIISTSLNGGSFENIDTVSAEVVSTGILLDQEGEYLLKVKAYNNEGNSEYSNSVFTGMYNEVPAPPSNLEVTPVFSREVRLTWKDNSENENGFYLEIKSEGNYSGIPENPLNRNDTAFSLKALDPLTTYSVRLFSHNNMGSSNTVEISFQTPDPSEDGIIFPPEAGVISVKDYGALGDGIHDDTEAIQAALNDAAKGIVYIPFGTYLVTDRLEWPADARNFPLILIGQDKEKCIIKLSDSNFKFQNPSIPRSVIWTQEMGSADNFRNFIRNLTINTGTNNEAAIGIQFMSNNMGSISNVDIVSGDGKGLIGLDLGYNSLNGPLFISKVRIDGFRTGIKSSGSVNSQTLEHITLENQTEYGIHNSGQVFSIRKLNTVNVPVPVYNSGSGGVLTLLEAHFSSGEGTQPAIINQGCLFARNVIGDNYSLLVDNRYGNGENVDSDTLMEYTSHNVFTQFPWTYPRSLGLDIEETPEIPWETDPEQWANVQEYGAIPDDSNDDTEAIQSAINSGKTHVYFPYGSYDVSGSLSLEGNVKRMVGLESILTVGSQSEPVLILGDSPGSPDTVEIQHLYVTPHNTTPAVDNRSQDRTLVVRYCKGFGGTHTGTGKVFYEDVGTGVHKPIKFLGGKGQKAWIRQLSNEPRDGVTHFENKGATVWILGHKTEMPGTLIETTEGGETEVNGAFAYIVGGDNSGYPMYINHNSSMSVTLGTAFYTDKYDPYNIIVEEIQNSVMKELEAADLPDRAGFKMTSLYVGYPDDGNGSIPDAPTELASDSADIGSVLLSWEDNSWNETGFIIEMKESAGDFTIMDTARFNNTRFFVGELALGQTYCFRIRAFNELGESPYTDETCIELINTGSIEMKSYPGETVVVYPNPFEESFLIKTLKPGIRIEEIEVFDLTGRIRVRKFGEESKTEYTITKIGGITDLEKGVFILRILYRDESNNKYEETRRLMRW